MKDAFLELLNGHEEERKRKLGFRKETLILEIRKREKRRREEERAAQKGSEQLHRQVQKKASDRKPH